MFGAILLFALLVRVIDLKSNPPGLWYDEAIYALDALSIGHGNWPIFFTTENHMREPLYIYSLAAFFALFGHSVVKARLATAIWGTATVAAFWLVARRILGREWGLIALFAFAVFRWHVHFSRAIFRASLPPLFILLVVLFMLRWVEKRRLRDAAISGAMLGLGMYTYLSFRLVPLLIIAWAAWLWLRKNISFSRDGKAMAAFAASALVVFAPLGADYIRHPTHFSGRTGEVSMFLEQVTIKDSEGEHVVEQRKPFSKALLGILGNTADVAEMWTIDGDHEPKHNVPGVPVFDWANGMFFYAGLAWCVVNLMKEQAALVLLTWIFLMSLTSIFSFGAPNLLRMQGITPAVILVYATGMKWIYDLCAKRVASPVRIATVATLLVLFAGIQLYTEFFVFPRSPEVQRSYLKEVFYDPAEQVRSTAPSVSKVFVPEEMAMHPSFRFVTAGIRNIVPYSPSFDVPTTATRPFELLTTIRSEELSGAVHHDQRSEAQKLGSLRTEADFYVAAPDSQTGQMRRVPWGTLWIVR
jgi:4-amino-4-deoxy-L-arabinose transferase-like glycosyltransferase